MKLCEFLLQSYEDGLQRSKMAYRSFVRSENQSSLRRIHGTTSSHLATNSKRWETVWRNTPRIWQDFGSALPSRICLTQPKPVLPLPNEHGSQVKDQSWRQCCHTNHKKLPYRPTRDIFLLSGHGGNYRCKPWVIGAWYGLRYRKKLRYEIV
jgi:hypothetical protein